MHKLLETNKKYIILHWHGSAVSCFRHFSYAILYFSIYRHLHYVLGMRWFGLLGTVDCL